jgi:hypothetical protein
MRSHLHIFVVAIVFVLELQLLAGAVAPVLIVRVAGPPSGETISPHDLRFADPMGDDRASALSIDAGKRHLTLKVEYDPFLTAYEGSKQVWQVKDFV